MRDVVVESGADWDTTCVLLEQAFIMMNIEAQTKKLPRSSCLAHAQTYLRRGLSGQHGSPAASYQDRSGWAA